MVSTSGGYFSQWRHDGKEIFYLGNNWIMAVEAQTEPTFTVGAPKKLFWANAKTTSNTPYVVTADGQRFLVNGQVAETGSQRAASLVLNWRETLEP